MPHYSEFLHHLREGVVIPFVGAGVSLAVKKANDKPAFPGWSAFLRTAGNSLVRKDPTSDEDKLADAYGRIVHGLLDLAPARHLEAATFAKAGLGPRAWVDLLVETFNPRVEFDEKSLELPRAIWELGSKLVITTNYDKVLRNACPRGERDFLREWSIGAPAGLAKAARGGLDTCVVWHLHGTVDQPESVILDSEGYDALYPSEEGLSTSRTTSEYLVAIEALKTLLVSKTLLFIGFSFDDRYFNRLLRFLSSVYKGCNAEHYALFREDPAKVAQMKSLFADIGIRPIYYRSHEALTDLLRQMRQDASALKLRTVGSGSPHPMLENFATKYEPRFEHAQGKLELDKDRAYRLTAYLFGEEESVFDEFCALDLAFWRWEELLDRDEQTQVLNFSKRLLENIERMLREERCDRYRRIFVIAQSRGAALDPKGRRILKMVRDLEVAWSRYRPGTEIESRVILCSDRLAGSAQSNAGPRSARPNQTARLIRNLQDFTLFRSTFSLAIRELGFDSLDQPPKNSSFEALWDPVRVREMRDGFDRLWNAPATRTIQDLLATNAKRNKPVARNAAKTKAGGGKRHVR